jgi:hypothetical protein
VKKYRSKPFENTLFFTGDLMPEKRFAGRGICPVLPHGAQTLPQRAIFTPENRLSAAIEAGVKLHPGSDTYDLCETGNSGLHPACLKNAVV